jgi:O-antigen/teichoic acid export membrane protein
MRAESRFKRNILRIAAGSVASQAIVIGATPLLTRLYGPEEFGALAVFVAAYAITVGLITLKYDLSIILPRDDGKAVELTILTLVISLALSLVLLVALGLSRLVAGVPALGYLFLLPLATVLGAAYTCAQQWGARASDYRRYARSQVMNSVLSVGTSVLLALIAADLFGGLAVGFVVGISAGLIYLTVDLLRVPRAGRHYHFRTARLVETALEFKQFPLFVLPSTILLTLGVNAPPFILQTMFSLQEVGYYAIANRFLVAPISLIGGAVAEAFRAEFVDRHKRGVERVAFFRGTLRRLMLVGVPVFGGFFLVAPELFAFLLGEPYRESGVMSRYLCVGVFAQFVAQPFHYVFVATGHVRLGLVMQSALTGLPLLAIVVGGLSGSMIHAVLSAAVLTFVLSALMIVLAYRCCRYSDRPEQAGA